jgi:hypothetical protein
MGNTCCSERKPNLYSFFQSAKSSFLGEGNLDTSKLDVPDEMYSDLQVVLCRHWDSVPKQEKQLRYLMSK